MTPTPLPTGLLSVVEGSTAELAKWLGAPVVVVPYGYREGRAVQDLAADAIVDSLDDLPERVAVRRTPDSR